MFQLVVFLFGQTLRGSVEDCIPDGWQMLQVSDAIQTTLGKFFDEVIITIEVKLSVPDVLVCRLSCPRLFTSTSPRFALMMSYTE